jgi:hypothetical protein
MSGYDELKLRVERSGSEFRVHASTGSAEASGTFAMPWNEIEVENFVLRASTGRRGRRAQSPALTEAKRFGGRLFEALFAGPVRTLYTDAMAAARYEDRGLRLTLCLSGAPELMDVPWEYLFDDPNFLSVSSATPIVRYLDLPRPHRPLRAELPLRILAVISSPMDYHSLDVDLERKRLEEALVELIRARVIEIDWLEHVTLPALLATLQRGSYQIIHYIGHGGYDRHDEDGLLVLEDDEGWARRVTGDQLGMMLRDFTSLRLAILNACEGARTSTRDQFAGVAASLVQRDIPAVIAMQFEISDHGAIAFAFGFYQALATGRSVDAALAAGRLSIFAAHSDDIEWGTPVLFMRVPDGQIFDVPEAPVVPTRPPRLLTGSVSARRPRPPVVAAPARSDVAPERPVGAGGAAVPPPDDRHYYTVLQYMVGQGTVVPVLGSQVGGPVSGAVAVAEDLAGHFGLDPGGRGLTALAQHVYVSVGRPDLHRTLRQILGARSEPGPVHRWLARFPRDLAQLGLSPRYPLIMTTNYDSALERAFAEEQEPFDLAIYMASGEDRGRFVHVPFDGEPRAIAVPNEYGGFPIDDFGELERTVIMKVHGGVDASAGGYGWSNNYVVTEDHYVDYLCRSPIESLVPVQILAKLTESHCLFLGYPMRDWSARVFLKRVWQGEPLAAKSWAIEQDPDSLEQDFWRQSQIDLYSAVPGDYADALRERLLTPSGAAR